MAAMRASLTSKAGLVQPLPARVATFKPASCSRRNDVAARASFDKATQHLATLGAAGTALFAAGSAHADSSLVQAAEAVNKATNDNRLAMVATMMLPALGWVAYNILEPAMGQYRNMRLKSTAVGLGLGAAALFSAQQAQAANEIAELAAGDNRLLILGVVFVPALGWVAFNILGPALNQYANMGDANKKKGKK